LACESISTGRTFLPLWASPADNQIVVDVLPVPPFWLAIDITIFVNSPKALSGCFGKLLV
jgi:hypothetical protein